MKLIFKLQSDFASTLILVTHDETIAKQCNKIIKFCSEKNYREILLITGKGLHSNNEDVYKSSDLSKLRFSIPEFINSDPDISRLILSTVNPPQNEGGEGALLIKLKKITK